VLKNNNKQKEREKVNSLAKIILDTEYVLVLVPASVALVEEMAIVLRMPVRSMKKKYTKRSIFIHGQKGTNQEKS